MSTEDTLPPKQPNTPRVWLKKLWDFGAAHLVLSAAVLGSLLGFIAGKIL